MAYGIYTSSHGKCMSYPINFPSTKPITCGEPRNLALILFSYHSLGAYFSIRFSSYGIYTSSHEKCMGFISHKHSHSVRKVSQSHWMGKAWEFGFHNFLITWELFFHEIHLKSLHLKRFLKTLHVVFSDLINKIRKNTTFIWYLVHLYFTHWF